MKCSRCGAEVKETMKFCPVCGNEMGKRTSVHGTGTIFEDLPVKGTKTGQSDAGLGSESSREKVKKEKEAEKARKQQEKENKKRNKKKMSKGKKVLVTFLVICLLVIVAAIADLVYYIKSPAREIMNKLNQGDYTTIQTMYKREVEDNFLQELLLKKLAEKELQTVIDEFKNETMTYEEVSEKLQAIQSLNIDSLASLISENLEMATSLNDSMAAYEKAEKLYADGQYTEAMEAYAKVVEADENYDAAQSKMTECVESYKKDILAQTENPTDTAEYENAISIMEVAIKVLPDAQEFIDREKELTEGYAALLKSEALNNSAQYIKNGQYQELFDLIDKALEKNKGDQELTNLQKTTVESFEKAVKAQTDTYLSNEQYDEAIFYLQESEKVLPSDKVITDLLTDVQNKKPIPLCDLKITEVKDCEQVEAKAVQTDSVGNTYSPGNLFKMDAYRGDIAYSTYYTNKQYTKIKGTIAVSDDSDYCTAIFSIYDENGKILYTSGNVDRKTAPKKIEADLTGVEWITISLECIDGYYHSRMLVSDFVLYKD